MDMEQTMYITNLTSGAESFGQSKTELWEDVTNLAPGAQSFGQSERGNVSN